MPSSIRKHRKTQGPGLSRFFRWWGRELMALIPRSLRVPSRPAAGMLWLSQESGAMVFWRQHRGARREIGRIATVSGGEEDARIAFEAIHSRDRKRPVGLCIPGGQVLRKDVVLPLAAAENLNQVLGFELSRLTPFSANQAYYAGNVVSEDRESQRLFVRLTATPRPPIDELIGSLDKWGVTPHAVVVDDELSGPGDCVNLLPPERRPPRGNPRYWIHGAMAALTLCLLMAVLVIPLWQKREMLIALQPMLAKAQQQAEAVNALKKEQGRLLAEYNYPLEQKLARPAKVILLEEITRLLPDGTWLQQLDINAGEVSMQGNTQSSSKLIGIFEKSPLLQDASFKSPLVKAQGGEERFQLTAAIKTIPLAEALAAQRALSEGKKKPGKVAAPRNTRPTGGKGGKP